MERKTVINIHDIENVVYTDEKWLTYGNVYIVVDMELKGRIREALIKMILGFNIEDMDLEPEK